MKHDGKWKCEEKDIPEDLQFLQDFYDGWIAEQMKEERRDEIQHCAKGYEV